MSIFFYSMFYVFGISFIYTFSVFLFRVLYIFLYLSCVHLSCLLYVFSMFLFFVRLHSMFLVYVFFIFWFYDLLHSSLSYLYYRILSCYPVLFLYFIYICTFLFYLSYTLCFCILSVLFLCLFTYFHMKLYCTSYSCDHLYFHRIARLCFSYHIILYTFHIHFLFGFMSGKTLEADSGNNWVYPKVLSLYETVISIC